MAKKTAEQILEERRKKNSFDPYGGDPTAKQRNIKFVDDKAEDVYLRRSGDYKGSMTEQQSKDYARPYYDFTRTGQQNSAIQKTYDTLVKPNYGKMDLSDPFKPKTPPPSKPTIPSYYAGPGYTAPQNRPKENATHNNIPRKDYSKATQQLQDTFKTTSPIQPTRPNVPQSTANQMHMSPMDRMNEFEYQTGAKRPSIDPTNPQSIKDNIGKYPYAPQNQGSIRPLTATENEHNNKRKFGDQVKQKTKAFLTGVTAPITKPLARFFNDGMKDKNGKLPQDGSTYNRINNWYMDNQANLIQAGYSKKAIKDMMNEDLRAAQQEDNDNLLKSSMDKPRRYDLTGADRFANMAGEVTGSVGAALGTGSLVGAAAPMLNPIAQSALVGGITGATSSYGERNDIATVAKDMARQAMFYGAGKVGSDYVGKVAGELISKYGLETSAAALYATEAVKGLAFDAAGYGATLPTYPLMGDAMPTAKDVAFDMAVGALFDMIPNMFDVKGTLDHNKQVKAHNMEAAQVRMDLVMQNIKNNYAKVGEYEKTAPHDIDTLESMYDAMLNDIEYIKGMTRGQYKNVPGQEETIIKLNEMFGVTEDYIQWKKQGFEARRQTGTEGPMLQNKWENPTAQEMGARPTPEAVAGAGKPYQQKVTGEPKPYQQKVEGVGEPYQSRIENRTIQEVRAVEPPQPRPDLISKNDQKVKQEPQTAYGKNGKKAFTKWGQNESVMADLNNTSDPYTQDYKRFFEAWYEAGRLGLPEYQVRVETANHFPAFLETAFYQAGKNDMEKGSPKAGTNIPRPETQELVNPITTPLKPEEAPKVDGINAPLKGYELPEDYEDPDYKGEYKAFGPKGEKLIGNDPNNTRPYQDGVMGKTFDPEAYGMDAKAAEKLYNAGLDDRNELNYRERLIINQYQNIKGQLKRLIGMGMGDKPIAEGFKKELQQFTPAYEKLDPRKFKFQSPEPTAPKVKPEDQEGYVESNKGPTIETVRKRIDHEVAGLIITGKPRMDEEEQGSFTRGLTELTKKTLKDKAHSQKSLNRKIQEYFRENTIRFTMLNEAYNKTGKNTPQEIYEIQKPFTAQFLSERRAIKQAAKEKDIQKTRYAINERIGVLELMNPMVYAIINPYDHSDPRWREATDWIKTEAKEDLIQEVLKKLGFSEKQIKQYGTDKPNEPTAPGGRTKVEDFESLKPGTIIYDKNLEAYTFKEAENLGNAYQLKVENKNGETNYLYTDEPIYKDNLPNKVNVEQAQQEPQKPKEVLEVTQAEYDAAKADYEASGRPFPPEDIELKVIDQEQEVAATEAERKAWEKQQELEAKKTLNERHKEAYDYLKAYRHGKKAAVYYKSPELAGVDDLKAISNFIRFIDDKKAHKLDVFQMEMAKDFPEVKDLGLEEFGQFLVDSVKAYRSNDKDIKKTTQEAKQFEEINPLAKDLKTYTAMYEQHKEAIKETIWGNEKLQKQLNRITDKKEAAITLVGPILEELPKYAKNFRFENAGPDELAMHALIYKELQTDETYLNSFIKPIIEGENKNEPVEQIRTNGEGSLEEVPTENVQGTKETGETTPTAPIRTGTDERGNDTNDGSRDGLRPGVGDSENEIHSTTTGEGSRVEEKPQAQIEQEAAEAQKDKVQEEPKGKNFSIKEDLDLAKGPKGKYADNIEAIKLVKQLELEQRIATPQEQKILSKYVGWGGLAKTFSEYGDWKQEYLELKALLTPEEYSTARSTVTDSYYTPIEVIEGIYKGLQKLGLKGGRALEPGAGVGNFIGTAPGNLKNLNFTGVERDTITGRIAKYLYPNSNIQIKPFEKANIPQNFYDIAIGNVPFGNITINDKDYPSYVTEKIHNYFIAKAIDSVRPGGLVAVITHTGTLDTSTQGYKEYIMKKADLIGAIRLPNGTFKSNAGTNVVSDLVVFKKREPGTPYNGAAFTDIIKVEMPFEVAGRNGTTRENVNEYFVNHPEMVIGEWVSTKNAHNEWVAGVKAREGEKIGEQITKALSYIDTKMDYPTKPQKDIDAAIRQEIAADPDVHKENAYVVGEDGTLYTHRKGVLKPYEAKDAATAERIKGMIDVRNAARKAHKAQLEDKSEKAKEDTLKELNRVYDNFVKKHGYINDPANKRAYIDDPDFAFLLSLENYDAATKTATKSDTLKEYTVEPVRPVTHVDTSKEALIVTLNETGDIDIERMVSLTGKTEAQVIKDLEKEGLVFPTEDGYEIAERYLSGNVRAKLRQAEALAEVDPKYKKNVEALKKVQPRDLKAAEISPQIGQTWIPSETYKAFMGEMLELRPSDFKVAYQKGSNNWNVKYDGVGSVKSAKATKQWGTAEYPFMKLMECAFKNKDPKVMYKDSEGKQQVAEAETALARQKLEEIKEEFASWIFRDGQRAKTMVDLYNYTQNNLAIPNYDGSHLRIKGLNPKKKLRPHQANAVWRIVSSGGNTLLAHKVGAGKTFEMQAAGMALKQMGIIKKPMYVVPNSMVEQFGKEFLELFPGANVLIAGPDSFSAAKRKVMVNRIATGNWDGVIVAHTSFGKISMRPETIEEHYMEQIRELEEAVRQAAYERDKSVNVKDLERSLRNLRAKMEKKLEALNADTQNTPFEELGVDSIFVDEAHAFKNLMYVTKMDRVGGLGSKDGNDKTLDMLMKIRHLQKMNGGKGVVFATATPVMNTMAEMYIMQKYLQPQALEEKGIANFDAWAAQFGEVVTTLEMKPEGNGYREKQMFSKFKNLGELVAMFRSFADVMTDIPGLKVPKVKGGKPTVITCEASENQKILMRRLIERAEAVRRGGGRPEKGADNMLSITTDGRMLAVDARLVDPTMDIDEGGKVSVASDKILEIWKATKKDKMAQMVFCDFGVPGGSSSKKKKVDNEDDGEGDGGEDFVSEKAKIYEDLKKLLIKKGIPEKQIAFAHDAKDDTQKLILYRKINTGEIRVIIGSTGKLGVGVNVQKKLVAMHHINAPLRPGDVSQRDGRIIRQGNDNEEVEIFHYVTKGTFDARLWDILLRKQKFIDDIMNGTTDMRTGEDISDAALSAEEAIAAATDNPLVKEKMDVGNKLRQLENAKKGYENSLVDMRIELVSLEPQIKGAEETLRKINQDIAARENIRGEAFSMTIDGKTYTERDKAAEKLWKEVEKLKSGGKEIGRIAGFRVIIQQPEKSLSDFKDMAIMGPSGRMYLTTAGKDAKATLQRLENAAMGLEKERDRWEGRITETKERIKVMKEEISKPYPKQAELERLKDSYETLNQALSTENLPPELHKEMVDRTLERVRANREVHGMTSMRGQSHTKVHEPTGKNTDVKGTKSASQIFKAFEKQFGAAIKRRPKRGTLGTYNSREHLIRVKKANDIAVLCHETGHLLDRTYKWSEDSKAPYAKELMRLGETSSKKSYSDEKRRREGVAEFLRYYFTEPETAQASSFYNYFVESMEKGELDAVNKLQHEIWKLLNLSPEDSMGKAIKFYDEKYKGPTATKADWQMTIEDVKRMAKNELWDENYNLYWAAEKMGGKEAKTSVENKVAQFRGHEGKAMFDLVGEYQTNLKGEKVGRSYEQITRPIHKDKKTRHLFMEYQAARRGLDYHERKLEFPRTLETCKNIIKNVEYEHPEFKEIFEELLQFRRNETHKLVESGIMSEKDFKRMVDENPNYVPLKRDFENYKTVAGTGKKMAASRNVIKKVKGSGRDIIDPEVNDITNTFAYQSAAERNAILLKLADLSKEAQDAGHIMSKSQIPMKSIELNRKQLEKIISEVMEKNDLGQMENMDLDVMNRIFKPNYSANENQVIVYRNGKPELYDIHPHLYKTISGLNVDQANVIIELMNRIGRVSKAGIIFTPTYLYRNISRDTFQNLIGSEAGITVLDIFGGLYSTLTNDRSYQEFKKHGGTVNYFLATDTNFLKETIDAMKREQKKAPAKLLHKIKHPLNTIQDLIEPLENAGRVAEYKKVLKKAGYSEESIAKAINAGRDLSVDFKRCGALIKKLHLNKMINFFNPQIQGMAKDLRLLTNKRTALRTVVRAIAYLTMPTLALWWLNKDNENYQELSAFQKDNFFNVPIPIDGDFEKAEFFIPIPKPFGMGSLFSALPERITEKAYRNNPRAFDGYGETLMQAWGVPFMPSAFNPYYEASINENYLGNPIINLGDQRLPGYLQSNNYTSETAKGIAQLTKNLPLEEDSPFKSAKKIDHMIKGYTGTLGTVGLGAVDAALGKERTALEPLLKGFVVDSTRRPETINRFYDYKQSLDLAYAETMLTKEKSKYFDPAMREVFTNINSKLGDLAKVRQALEGTSNGPEKEKQLLELDAIELKLMKAATGMFEEKYRK